MKRTRIKSKRPGTKASKPVRRPKAKRPFINPAEARLGAERHVLRRMFNRASVRDGAAVRLGIDELRGKVSTVGMAAPPEKLRELARRFACWGATRICPLGQMQNPPLTWRHDGRPALGDIVLWTDVEA